MRRAFLPAAVALVTPACGLFFSIDGYEGPASDAAVEGPPDAPLSDIPRVDAPADTPGSEAPGNADADAGGDAKAAPDAPWCSLQTHEAGVWSKCFDYDELDAGLNNRTMNNAMLFIERDGAASSPPGDLVAEVPALAPYPDTAFAWDGIQPQAAATTAYMAFDFRTSATDQLFLSGIGWGGAANYTFVSYVVDVNGAGVVSLHEQGDYPDGGYNTMSFPSNAALDSQWHRLELTVDASSGAATLRIDGVEVIDAGAGLGGVYNAVFRWGVDYISGQTMQTDDFHFDNVVVEARP